MPSGCTAPVADGKITDFTAYAMRCARAFGACIMMRDEPMDAAIPSKFDPDPYHWGKLKEEKLELDKWRAMTMEARRVQFEQTMEQERKYNAEQRAECATMRARYESMLAKAKEFKSPSPEHDRFAEFLVSQLEESIRSDCNESYYEDKSVSFEEWCEQREQGLIDAIGYHENHWQREVERAKQRTEWIDALRRALPAASEESADAS